MFEGMSIATILDGLVAVLLVTTIGYAALLSRRIAGLRAGKAEMRGLIADLTAATTQAESGISGLKSASVEQGEQLQQRLEKAKALRDDLSYLLDRGDSLADRLAGSIRLSRQLDFEVPVEAAGERPVPAAESRTEAALRRALQQMR